MLSEEIYQSWASVQKEKFVGIERQLPHDFFSGITLDIGCGLGYLEKFFEGQFIGIDNSLKMLPAGFPCVLGDGSQLPFHNGCFDTVVSIDAMHLIATDDYFRVLKKGGFVLFSLFFNNENYEERRSMLLKRMNKLTVIKEFIVNGRENEFVVIGMK